jgi:hypothetical protein
MSVSQSSEQGEETDTADGAVPVEADSAAQRIRTLDFSQPTKFTTEIRRRIVRALDPCCETLS